MIVNLERVANSEEPLYCCAMFMQPGKNTFVIVDESPVQFEIMVDLRSEDPLCKFDENVLDNKLQKKFDHSQSVFSAFKEDLTNSCFAKDQKLWIKALEHKEDLKPHYLWLIQAH